MIYRKTCSDDCARLLLVENAKKQHKKGLLTREKEFAEKFNTKYAGRFKYVSGYENCESIITCKCLICGHEETITARCVRKKTGKQCGGCREIERDEAERVKAEEKEKRVEEREKAKLEKRNAYEKSLLAICPECGNEYRRTGKGKDGGLLGFCSIDCRNKKRNRLKELRRRRVHKNGPFDRTINLQWLINRDKNKCKICGRKVDINDYEIIDGIFAVGENYPSIDHIIPVSRGGTHTSENVQLSHMKCNRMKNDKEVYTNQIGQMIMVI